MACNKGLPEWKKTPYMKAWDFHLANWEHDKAERKAEDDKREKAINSKRACRQVGLEKEE